MSGLRHKYSYRSHYLYLEVHGVLITLLIIPLKGLIGVIPLISRVISTVIIG